MTAAWLPLTPGGGVRFLRYSFGPGTANSLAIRTEPRRWLVVSPPLESCARACDELAAEGDVVALLAPNAYHHRGQAAWRSRFPGATSYAPEGALSRLARQAPAVEFRPAQQLVASLPPVVHLMTPEGQKQPDLLVRAELEGAVVWWLGDLFSNAQRGDQRWWLRVVSRLAGSGLGYRRNARPELVYVDDRTRWLASIRSAISARPPTIVVPAHGDPIREDAASRTLALLE